MSAIDAPEVIGISWGLTNIFFGKPTMLFSKNKRKRIFAPIINLSTDDKYTLVSNFNYGF